MILETTIVQIRFPKSESFNLDMSSFDTRKLFIEFAFENLTRFNSKGEKLIGNFSKRPELGIGQASNLSILQLK